MKGFGFSLIELLIVISIVGILAAIAVPAYSQYKTKAIYVKSIAAVQGLISTLVNQYGQHGRFPATLTYSGVVKTMNVSGGETFSVVNVDEVYAFQYGYNSNPTQNVVLWVYVDSGPLAAYPNPYYTTLFGRPGIYLVSFAFREINGTMRVACGARGSFFVGRTPLNYLPASCQCTETELWAGGVPGLVGCPY